MDLTRKWERETILPRDVEVAELLASGLNRVQISARLGVSLSTVGRQVGKMYRLTGTTSLPRLLQALRDAGHLAATEDGAGKRAAAIVRGLLLPVPDGDVEEHVNRVLETVARELEEKL